MDPIQYNPGTDPRPFNTLTPEEQVLRSGGTTTPVQDQNSGNFKIDIPPVIDSESIRNNFNGGITSADISSTLAEMRANEAKRAEFLVPTAREKQLQQQLAGFQTGVEKDISQLETRPGLDFFSFGRAEAQTRRQAAPVEAGIQRNLALEQGARDIGLKGAEVAGQGIKDRFAFQLQADQALRQKEQLIQNAIDKQSDNARNAISTILTNFGGLEWKNLDPATQTSLTKLANNAGFPLGLIQSGLQVMKDRQLNNKKTGDLQEYNFAVSQGFKGSFLDYQQKVSNLKRPTTNNYFGNLGSPSGIDSYALTSHSGLRYIDSSQFQGKSREEASKQANLAGIPFISKEQAEAVQEIDNARLNQESIITQISSLLPKDASGRITAGPLNKLSQIFQTNDQIAAFSSWRTAAINTLRATAGSKGLRINQAEIQAAVQNDIPQITDTIGTAEQKFKNIKTLLDNAEKSILIKNRTILGKTDGNFSVTAPNGKTYTFPDQKSLDNFKKSAKIQ